MHGAHQSAISAALKPRRRTGEKSVCLLKDADRCGPVKRRFKCLSAALGSSRHQRRSVKVFIGSEVEERETRRETRSDCEFLLLAL